MISKSVSYGILILLIGGFAIESVSTMKDNSMVLDELHHIATGYVFLKKGKFNLNHSNPPLIKQILTAPLLFLKMDFPEQEWQEIKNEPILTMPTTRFATHLIFYNRVPGDKIIFVARCAGVAIACAFALLIFIWASQLWNETVALASVFLYASYPPIIGHAGLAMIDIGGSFFMFLFLWRLWRLFQVQSGRNIVFAGVALGFALVAKIYGVFLFPFALIIYFIHRLRNPSWSIERKYFVFVLLIALGVLLLDYGFVEAPQYITNLRYIFGTAIKRGWGSYLLGKISSGQPHYFIVDLAVKASPILLALVIGGIYGNWSRQWSHFLLVPVFAYFVLASFSKLQIGIRHIFPIFPFLFMFGGYMLVELFKKKKGFVFGILAIVATLIETARTHPHYLAYASFAVGGLEGSWRVIDDMDFGQDLKRLSEFLKKYPDAEIVLSYNQVIPIEQYGIRAQRYFSAETSGSKDFGANSLNPSREFLVVSRSRLLYMPDKFEWLNNRPVDLKVGTFLIYDITRDRRAHEQMAKAYGDANFLELAERERKRAILLK